MAAFCFDAALGVKVIHSNERVAETIWWHPYFYKMGKISFNRLGALSAFGACHFYILRDCLTVR